MLPSIVAGAYGRATKLGFVLSCEVEVGHLLRSLAAAVPTGGRILEIGTGAGVGTAWIVDGVGSRSDLELVTIDNDRQLSESVASVDWPSWVRFEVADAEEAVPKLGQFNLVFADAVAGKWYGLDLTIAAIAPGGIVIVDDMTPTEWASEEHKLKTDDVRTSLMNDDRLASCFIAIGSGVILSTKRAL